jgi:uncharacterized protein YecT (DUF1311 family)
MSLVIVVSCRVDERPAGIFVCCRGFVKASEGGHSMQHWSNWMARGAVLIALAGGVATAAHAQDEKPTAQQIAAVRACAADNENDVTAAERTCLFELVAKPCQNTPEGQSNLGMADCFRRETAIWDEVLNDNFKALRELLDQRQVGRLREMQRVWIASRDLTCGFYDVRIQGSMAIPMAAACVTRETARRALLLKVFTSL